MKGSSIGEFLFGFPDRPLTRVERIQIIRDRVRDPQYITPERLDQAIEKMLEEIRDQ